jgi:hypothetical protein
MKERETPLYYYLVEKRTSYKALMEDMHKHKNIVYVLHALNIKT